MHNKDVGLKICTFSYNVCDMLQIVSVSVYSFPMNPCKTGWKESYYKYNTHTVHFNVHIT
jgi:hypothetical protein